MSAMNSMCGEGMTRSELDKLNGALSRIKEVAKECRQRIAINGGKADKRLSFQLRVVHAALDVLAANGF